MLHIGSCFYVGSPRVTRFSVKVGLHQRQMNADVKMTEDKLQMNTDT